MHSIEGSFVIDNTLIEQVEIILLTGVNVYTFQSGHKCCRLVQLKG